MSISLPGQTQHQQSYSRTNQRRIKISIVMIMPVVAFNVLIASVILNISDMVALVVLIVMIIGALRLGIVGTPIVAIMIMAVMVLAVLVIIVIGVVASCLRHANCTDH